MKQTATTGNILTDGTTYSYEVYLGEGAADWQEIQDKPEYHPNNEVEPDTTVIRITKLQAVLVLNQYDLLDAVNSLVDTIGGTTKLIWENCTYIESNNPLVGVVCAQAGMSDEQIGQMFIEAAQL
jgi:hypothetical protein